MKSLIGIGIGCLLSVPMALGAVSSELTPWFESKIDGPTKGGSWTVFDEGQKDFVAEESVDGTLTKMVVVFQIGNEDVCYRDEAEQMVLGLAEMPKAALIPGRDDNDGDCWFALVKKNGEMALETLYGAGATDFSAGIEAGVEIDTVAGSPRIKYFVVHNDQREWLRNAGGQLEFLGVGDGATVSGRVSISGVTTVTSVSGEYGDKEPTQEYRGYNDFLVASTCEVWTVIARNVQLSELWPIAVTQDTAPYLTNGGVTMYPEQIERDGDTMKVSYQSDATPASPDANDNNNLNHRVQHVRVTFRQQGNAIVGATDSYAVNVYSHKGEKIDRGFDIDKMTVGESAPRYFLGYSYDGRLYSRRAAYVRTPSYHAGGALGLNHIVFSKEREIEPGSETIVIGESNPAPILLNGGTLIITNSVSLGPLTVGTRGGTIKIDDSAAKVTFADSTGCEWHDEALLSLRMPKHLKQIKFLGLTNAQVERTRIESMDIELTRGYADPVGLMGMPNYFRQGMVLIFGKED